MSYRYILAAIIVLSLTILPVSVLAEGGDDNDKTIFNLELEKVLNFGSGVLALILFVVTYMAYTRTRNAKLKYVSIAFLLFACKGFLTAHELFFKEWSWVDPTASVIDFAVLLIFFMGIMKK